MLHGFNSFHTTQPDHRVVALPAMVKNSSVMNTYMTGASKNPIKLIFKPLLHFFWSFGEIFCPLRLLLGVGSGPKTFLEPTNVDYQFLFLKCSPIFLF